jgi:hypothetical protein
MEAFAMSGIHPQSSGETFFVFCVGQSIPVINAFKTAMAHAGIIVKPLMGMYKGTPEYSFLASMLDYRKIEPWLNEEESILHIHSFNSDGVPKATLLYLKEGREEPVGRMYPVRKHEALQHDSWSYDPWYNNYFVCKW